MRLSPNDTHKFNMQTVVAAHAHLIAGRLGEAVQWAEMVVRESSSHPSSVLAASYGERRQRQQVHFQRKRRPRPSSVSAPSAKAMSVADGIAQPPRSSAPPSAS